MGNSNFKTVLLSALLLASSAMTSSADEIGRVDVNGREVILNDDNTWAYAKADPIAAGPCEAIESKTMPVTFCMDESVWSLANINDAAELQFKVKDETLYSLFITEKQLLAKTPFKKAILVNAQNAAGLKKIEVLEDSSASFSGQKMGSIKYRAEIDGLDITYLNYYVGMPGHGSMQILFFAETSQFKSKLPDINRVMSQMKIK